LPDGGFMPAFQASFALSTEHIGTGRFAWLHRPRKARWSVDTDVHYMRMANELAKMALGQTAPNPVVGAVVVHDDRVVGIGAHLRAGDAHAEVHALAMAGQRARGATLYVTLEPCAHHGRTPPCAEAVIAAGIRRVVVGVEDPDKRVAGRGVARMRAAGLQVEVGCLADVVAHTNRGFLTYARLGRPHVTLKLALTLDGRIAADSGSSRYVTGTLARERVQCMRDEADAVLVGIGTVLADDPALTVRLRADNRQPLRVVADTNLRTPLTAKLLCEPGPVVLVCGKGAAPEAEVALAERGAQIVRIGDGGRPTAAVLIAALTGLGVRRLLVEGGALLATSLLEAGLVDQLSAFVAPKLLGSGVAAVQSRSTTSMDDGWTLEDVQVSRAGDDVFISGRPVASARK
jgi:diaminohydroxyphosphoribosylaminopyrimidine deaminase/5-amino-6-(5-phosphoribosylamino)uracil reductase